MRRSGSHQSSLSGNCPVRHLALRASALLLALALSGWAEEDDHRIQFHAQGGTLDEVTKKDTEIVLASKDPITKEEAISALDRLSDKLKKLNHPKVTKYDINTAVSLIPKMKEWVNRNGPGGVATGKNHTEKKEDIRIDCEPIRGWVLIDNLPHAFEITASGWAKEQTRSWKSDKCPGRKIGVEEFEALKAEMFKEWKLDPKRANDLKASTAVAAWKDARGWFENVVLKEGMIEGEPKSKTISRKESEIGQQVEITLKLEVKVLKGIAFVEED